MSAGPGVLLTDLYQLTMLHTYVRRGDADAGPFRHALRAHVRATVEDKLRVANPRFLKSAGGTTR